MQLIQSIQFTRLSQFELNAVIATYFNRFTIFTCYPDPLTSILQTDGPITIVVYLRAMHIEWVGWPDSCGGGEWRGGCTQRDFTGSAHSWGAGAGTGCPQNPQKLLMGLFYIFCAVVLTLVNEYLIREASTEKSLKIRSCNRVQGASYPILNVS